MIQILLSLLIVIFVFVTPITAQKNIHVLRARNFLPHGNVEIRVKEYLKNDYRSFCFLPSYFAFDSEDIEYLRNQMSFEGTIPSSFSTDEGQWGILLIRTTTESDIIKFSTGINYPNTQVISAINRSSDRLMVCSELRNDEDLVIKLQKIENLYRPTSISVGLK